MDIQELYMKKLSVLSIIFFCIVGSSALIAATTWDIERSFTTEPGKRLDIDLRTGGDITVVGTSGNEVRLKIRKHGRDAEDLEVDVNESASGGELSSEYEGIRRNNWYAGVTIEAEVPSRYNVGIDTMGGDVTIRNIER